MARPADGGGPGSGGTRAPEAAVPGLRDCLKFDPGSARAYRASGAWNGDTVGALLGRWAAQTPDRIGLAGPAATLSYAEVHRQARRLAGGLRGLGIARGDVIAIQLPNVPEFVQSYFAACHLGAVLSPVHMPLRQMELEPLLAHAGARAVICGARTEGYDAPATMLQLKARLPGLQHVIVAGGAAPAGAVSLQALLAEAPAGDVGTAPAADDPALLCFTSGTSAAPKAVVHNHHTMLSNNRLCAPLYGLASGDVVLSAAPFTHAFGICVINFALLGGATHRLLPQFTPAGLAEAIEAGRPSLLFLAPAHAAMCLNGGVFDGRDLSSLRLVTISGAPCPVELARDLDERLPQGVVVQMWGMSESFMGLLTPSDAPSGRRFATVGKATPAVEHRIVGHDGVEAPDGAEGEIGIRGCSVIPGYFGNEAANRDSFDAQGWFRTGDLAVRDPDGFVRITGRVKDIINRGGVKFNPVDVEVLLSRMPGVAEVAIAPWPDPVLGERACAFVVPRAGAKLSLDAILRYLDEQGVVKLKWPERLEIIESMPITPTRKIIKSRLTQLLQQR